MRTDFNTVQEVLENYKSAIYEKDVERFVSSFSSNIHIYDCWEDWECLGISQWKEKVKEWFNGLKDEGVLLKTDFNNLVVDENSELAFVYCAVTFAAHNKSGEKLRQMTNRFSMGLRKNNDSWTITHSHSSLPISMETGKGIFNLK
ncbi:nuclear transport factor 2 family protein [Peribacillus psychrosaccharolyticus]|uniref:YybH family protein n=1 Tax=Peribacillus psychrosaccharolyticus TaxID=1407 RepID=UPI003D2908A2